MVFRDNQLKQTVQAMPEPTNWTIHLAARRPLRAAVVVAIIICGMAGVHLLGAHPLIMALAGLLLFGSVAEFLLPVKYTLDEKGAHLRFVGYHRVIPWKRVRRVNISANSIKLSPLSVKSPLDAYRGVLLRMADSAVSLFTIREWLQQSGAEYTEERDAE